MENDYRQFAKIYRQIVTPRHHFSQQIDLILALAELYALSTDSKILDASCGTGDVVQALKERGFDRLYAADGSDSMLQEWQTSQNSIPKYHVPWEKLNIFLDENGKFDLIYILGNSLAHFHPNKVPELFTSIYNGLDAHGLFICDLRQWSVTSSGAIIQQGREEALLRFLGTVKLPNGEYGVFDKPLYRNGVQEIQYYIRNGSTPLRLFDTLVYYTYTHEAVSSWLAESGFLSKNIYVVIFPQWPYLILAANK